MIFNHATARRLLQGGWLFLDELTHEEDGGVRWLFIYPLCIQIPRVFARLHPAKRSLASPSTAGRSVSSMAAALLVGLQASLSDLQPALQAELNLIAADHPTLALGLGWSSAGVTLSLAAGNVSIPGQPSRAARADDRFLFGSGTKPFTAVAVLRLVEAGALSLSDLVAGHVDEVLGRANGTSVAALYGAEAAAALTVGHLLHMQSGLPDFDTRALDATILADGRGEWPPYAILRAAATQAPQLHFALSLSLRLSPSLSLSLTLSLTLTLTLTRRRSCTLRQARARSTLT